MISDSEKQAAYLNELYAEEYNYWKNQLTGELEKSHFPYKEFEISNTNGTKQTIQFALNTECSQEIQKIANHSDIRIQIILMTFVSILLAKHTDLENILLGTVIFQKQEEKELINSILPLKIHIDRNDTVSDCIIKVKKVLSEAIKYENYPIELILKNSDIDEEYLDVAVVYEAIQDVRLAKQAGFHLICSFNADANNCIVGKMIYDTEYYSENMIHLLIERLDKLINQAIKKISANVKDIDYFSEQDNAVINQMNKPHVSSNNPLKIHEIFEKIAETYPDHIALSFYEENMTYDELNKKANQVAYHLRKKGVTRETTVAIYMKSGFEMIIAILGVLKSGGTYVPINIGQADNGIDFILKDSNALYVLTTKTKVKDTWNESNTLFIETILDENDNIENLVNINEAEDTAYIIYTSGTTGHPKGVMISHKNVIRLFFHEGFVYDISNQDVWLQFHSSSFDFSVWEIFGALLYGGRLCLISDADKRDYKRLVQYISEQKITVLSQTPSSLYQLIHEEQSLHEKKLNLRYITIGGEALVPIELKVFKERYPEVKIINMYGITETTVHSTYIELTMDDINERKSNIGKPFPTVEAYIMNKHGEYVPIGVIGELWIGGEGVAKGYLNRPELTEEKFQNVIIRGEKRRIYKSGDLCRYMEKGTMEYVGRADKQVKIRGYRIELNEIQLCLLSHKAVQDAVVAVRSKMDGEKILCAYVVLKEGLTEKIHMNQLRKYMKDYLSDYMVPSFILPVKKIELTVNGKVDYKKLEEIELKNIMEEEFVLPSSELEIKIADIWKEILQVDQVGIHNTIFDYGGTSFDVIRISNRLTEALSCEISAIMLFQYTTIKELAEALELNDTNDELNVDVRDVQIEKGKQVRLKKYSILKK